MRKATPILCLALCLALPGCSTLSGVGGWIRGDAAGEAARPLPYRASFTRGEDRRDLTIRVQAPASATVDQVRESARFEATRYCIPNFGGSDARWTIDPVTGDWAFTRDGNEMIFNARCLKR